jgi:hypothetical protein
MNDNNGLDFETDSMDESQNQTGPASLQDNPGLKDISRHSFRLPIQKIGTVEVSIAEHTLALVNIVVNDRIGIGVRVPNDSIFTRDQELPSIRFKLLDQDFSFQGKVQHISPDVTGHYLCGILLTQLTDKDRSTLKILAHKLHSEIFR